MVSAVKKKKMYNMPSHLRLEPERLGGSTWLQKRQAAPLAGSQKWNIRINYKPVIYFFFHIKLQRQMSRNLYLGSFDFIIHRQQSILSILKTRQKSKGLNKRRNYLKKKPKKKRVLLSAYLNYSVAIFTL